jgi:hypothetical protein
MVALNAGLLVGLIGFAAGAVTTLVLVLLVVIYHNTVGCNDKKDDEEDEGFVLPMSALLGGGGGPSGRISMADLQAYAATAARPAAAPESPKATEATGNYI